MAAMLLSDFMTTQLVVGTKQYRCYKWFLNSHFIKQVLMYNFLVAKSGANDG